MSTNDRATPLRTLAAVLARDLLTVAPPLPDDDPPVHTVMVGAAPAGEYATATGAALAASALTDAIAEVVERGVRRAGEEASAPAERARALLADHALDRLVGTCASPRSAALRVRRYVLEGTGMPGPFEGEGDAAPVTLERAAGGMACTAGEE